MDVHRINRLVELLLNMVIYTVLGVLTKMAVLGINGLVYMQQDMAVWNVYNMHTNMDVNGMQIQLALL